LRHFKECLILQLRENTENLFYSLHSPFTQACIHWNRSLKIMDIPSSHNSPMISTKLLGCLITCAALSALAIDAAPASAAVFQWTLTFTSGGTQIGSGEFSYDPDRVVVVRSPGIYFDAYIASKDAPLRPDFVANPPGLFQVTKYPNPLSSFTASLPNRTWTLADIPGGFAWWNPTASGVLGSFTCSRGSCAVAPQWFAGSTLGLAPGQFVMFDGVEQADGSYIGSFISAATSSPAPISGTWTAQAVPEPTTIAGAVLFGAGFLTARKKRSTQ